MLPNVQDIYFNQPKVKNALQILNEYIPLFGIFINQENESLDKSERIQELEKLNDEKDKLLQEKDDKISELFGTIEQYKKILESAGFLIKKNQDDKNINNLDYYRDENSYDDEDYRPENDDM